MSDDAEQQEDRESVMTEQATTVVVMVGPQASGKSTVAVALGQELRRRGERVAVVELDQIAQMTLPTLPSWDTAADIFALVTCAWADVGLTCVVAEGISSRDEVSSLRGRLPATAVVVTVAMTTPFETGLVRAQADLTRGRSRERDWLAERYADWPGELAGIEADVLLDMSTLEVDQGVSRVIAAIVSARSTRG